jgi:hypothetical protein
MAKDLKHKILWLIIGAISAVYLANLGAGVLELGPDNLPLIGNIDEFIVSIILMKSLAELGLNKLFQKKE